MNGQTHVYKFNQLKNYLINTSDKYDTDLITKAYEYAAGLHDGQYRKSGEDYITHPIAVAQICANMRYDNSCVCAALLHDVVEDCPDKTNIGVVKKMFGEQISSIVEGLTKLKSIDFASKEKESAENLRKMFIAMDKDPRVMFVKLCDRLHNMRTIASMTEEKQRTIALETMHIFAPVAHRLGIQKIKEELEDLSLKHLDSIGYNQIKNEFERRYGETRDLLEKCQAQIKSKLEELNIKRVTIEGRIKTINSLYRKIFMNGRPIEDVYDYYAIRVIVNTNEEIYLTLGTIHGMFPYIPDRFKDYISSPKENNYKSLHTTIMSDDDIPIEVQIRTQEMHETAEFGVAAHWKYKAGEKAAEEITKKLRWVKTLVEIDNEVSDVNEYSEMLKSGFYTESIYIYTPKRDVIRLPKGAIVLDFAYAIHYAIGNKTVGAKINGAFSPIDKELENGQVIEVITSKSSQGPTRDWVTMVKTGEARNKIKQWFKKEKRNENILIGREETDKIFKQFNKPLKEQERNDILTTVARREGFTLLDDFYNSIGYGGMQISKILPKIKEELIKIEEKDEVINDISLIKIEDEKYFNNNTMIIVGGNDNCQIKLAKCCNPLPGDDICGFMTQGHGLSVHKTNCRNFNQIKAANPNPDRFFKTTWNIQLKSTGDGYQTAIRIVAVDDGKLFVNLATLFAESKITVHSITEKSRKQDGTVTLSVTVRLRDLTHLDHVVHKIKGLKNIREVMRFQH